MADGIVLGAGYLAGGCIPGDVSGLRAGDCVGKPIIQICICKHWFTLKLVGIVSLLANIFNTTRILIKPV